MFHTLVRTIRRYYAGVVFGGYLLAFLLAFAMVFMLPIGALGLVLLGLLALVPLVFLLAIVRTIERPLALAKLRAGRCLACNAVAIRKSSQSGSDSYACEACGKGFSARGEDIPEPDFVNPSE